MSFRRNFGVLLVVLCLGLLAVVASVAPVGAESATAQSPELTPAKAHPNLGASSNPAGSDQLPGTGWLGRKIQEWLGAGKDTGIWFGGSWISDVNFPVSGGAQPGKNTLNSLFNLGLVLDAEKLARWPGGEFGIYFLQFNGSPTNAQAGSVQGYNSLPGAYPLNRSELYQLWWRQRLFNDKFIFRIGKVAPTSDFNNVLIPSPTQQKVLQIPAVSGLLFTPVFVNPTILGVLPGYYNSACGLTATVAPNEHFYCSYGFYDGNQAIGSQTGMRGPQFNGYYFHIGEVGANWVLKGLPGSFGLGGWGQTGRVTNSGFADNGMGGFYLFGSQRLWRMRPHTDNSGISMFIQYGINDSSTLSVNQYLGGGLTGFALLPGRPEDSCGIGVACSWLNQNLYQRNSEVILQSYYQMNLIGSTYFQPALSFIPAPGAAPTASSAWAVTLRFIALF